MSSGSDDCYNTNIEISTFSITLTLNVEIGDIFLFFFFFMKNRIRHSMRIIGENLH